MKIEANIHDCPGHIFSGYYVWYRVQAETKLVLKSNHYTLHLTSHYIPTSEFCLQGKKKREKKRNHNNSVLWHGFSGYSPFSLSYFRTKWAGNPAPAYRRWLKWTWASAGFEPTEKLPGMEWELLQHWSWSCCTHQRPTACSRGCDCCTVLSFSLSVPDQHFPHLLHALPVSARSANPGVCAVLCLWMPAWLQELHRTRGKDFCHTAPLLPAFNILGAETWKNSLTQLMFMDSHGSEHSKCHHKLGSLSF